MKFCNSPHENGFPPDQYKIDPYDFSSKDIRELILKIIQNKNEREIDLFFRKRLSLLAFASKFFSTGHHDTWIIPQPIIRPPGFEKKGLIPDYLFAGNNSDGITWWVIELKSPKDQLYKFDKNDRVVETEKHKSAISQLTDYIEYCDQNQIFIRETLGLKSFSKPYGLLICGRESELIDSPEKQAKKAFFNRNTVHMQVRTYDAFVRELQYMIGLKSKFPLLNNILLECLIKNEIAPFDREHGIANA